MRLTQRMMTGRFTLNDMYKQMEMMSKVGTIGQTAVLFALWNAWRYGGYEQIPKNKK